MKISFIIPAYNEAKKIGKSIMRAKKYFSHTKYDYEILVVDDGSSDDTVRAVRREGLVPICIGMHMGKGFAVRRGVQSASGSIIIFTDADLPYDLSLVSQSVDMLCSGAEVVIGSRSGGGYETYNLLRRVCSGVFRSVTNSLLHLGIPDTQCGFKAFNAAAARTVFERVTIDGFCFDAEALFIAKKLGFTVDSVPAHMMSPPKESSVHPFRDGLNMVRDVFTIINNDRSGVYGGTARLTKA